jgi:hypothetical protein
VKGAVNLISDFEQTAAGIAAEEGYRYVACGHIHQPEMKTIATPQGEVLYLNSGDWVENLTALEYTAAAGWQLYRYALDPRMQQPFEPEEPDTADTTLLADLLAEFKLGQKVAER